MAVPSRSNDERIRAVNTAHGVSSVIAWDKVERVAGDPFETGSPMHMDFENYTLGRLVPERANYDFAHQDYIMVRSQILWRIQRLGWTAAAFGEIDRKIGSERDDYRHSGDEQGKVDRYGKKYSWIAYFELKGWLCDRGILKAKDYEERTSSVDIYPSFAIPAIDCQLAKEDLIGEDKKSIATWIRNGPSPNLKIYSKPKEIVGNRGLWLALDGLRVQQKESKGRRLFVFLEVVRKVDLVRKRADVAGLA